MKSKIAKRIIDSTSESVKKEVIFKSEIMIKVKQNIKALNINIEDLNKESEIYKVLHNTFNYDSIKDICKLEEELKIELINL